MKDNELTELTSIAAIEKSLEEGAARHSLHASKRGDMLQMQLVKAQDDVRAYKRRLGQSPHKL